MILKNNAIYSYTSQTLYYWTFFKKCFMLVLISIQQTQLPETLFPSWNTDDLL